ncbi:MULTISPECIES: teichoic acid D-Ala incorporation-associated protein DltX [Enterococcaceae]|uniref:teichoic acid D-Ala incorporation-associated protein DltX n=1 Tax=Enterococcaceae TaxID=81852 RepID=UPI000E53BE8C|nr:MULTISPECIES: teichoic acid D-Ala incorporation-associated protein DltX [Enterococcaceae]MCI0130292.1 teichoic acid D-Ala incorporation-associated protein DltX [Vagococcus sp. CY53-2]RGI28452.1 teichoic acid D-Ala incorporation-associated protein DltX [Melissococcus sp. OM08-11BH]UNM89115.1 teichoic acid D-Ala incorporation-associated protein DltX [Vagococcus sp. CY52-2]
MELKKIEVPENTKRWMSFVGKTLFYAAIILVLIYLYQYSHVGGGSFIYNQF